MNVKISSNPLLQFTSSFYILLLALAFVCLMHPIPFMFGLTLSAAPLFIIVMMGWYSVRSGWLAAFIIYGISCLIGYIDLFSASLQLAELLVIGYALHKRYQRIITIDASFWLVLGAPALIVHQLWSYGELNSLIIYGIQITILSSFVSVYLADLILTYIPLNMGSHKARPRKYNFSKLMIHLALSVMLLPFFSFSYVSINSEREQMLERIQNQFQNESQQIRRIMSTRTDTELQALKLGSILQQKLLIEEFQTILHADTELVLLDEQGRRLVATFAIPSHQSTYDWRVGGEVTYIDGGLSMWIPDRAYDQPLLRQSLAYMVHEMVIPMSNQGSLTVITMIPYSTYLDHLISLSQSQLWVIIFIIISMLVLSWIYHHVFFRPLSRLAENTRSIPEKIAQGLGVAWPDSPVKEISDLVDNFRDVSTRLEDMFDEARLTNLQLQEQKERLEASERQLQSIAYYDALTGLPNRHSFTMYTEKLFADYTAADERTPYSIAVYFIDIDFFKDINDTYGHDVGDSLLRHIAERLSPGLGEDSQVFRISGDEFVLVSKLRRTEEAAAIADRLLDKVTQPVVIGEIEIFPTCSIGIALCPAHGETIDDLMKCADTAMYQAKQSGRNRYSLYQHQQEGREKE